jgi:hypothetical protein
MKTALGNSGPESLIAYLNLHTTILSEQGINVQAFIDRLSELKPEPNASQITAKRARRKSRKT